MPSAHGREQRRPKRTEFIGFLCLNFLFMYVLCLFYVYLLFYVFFLFPFFNLNLSCLALKCESLSHQCQKEKWVASYNGGLPLQCAVIFSSVQFSSVAQSCLTLCDPMDCSMPGFPVLHQLPKLAQTHSNWVSDAIQPSHPLSSPSPPAFNLSLHQGLFQWVNSSHQVAKVLEF